MCALFGWLDYKGIIGQAVESNTGIAMRRKNEEQMHLGLPSQQGHHLKEPKPAQFN